jgi:hypothetical protein
LITGHQEKTSKEMSYQSRTLEVSPTDRLAKYMSVRNDLALKFDRPPFDNSNVGLILSPNGRFTSIQSHAIFSWYESDKEDFNLSTEQNLKSYAKSKSPGALMKWVDSIASANCIMISFTGGNVYYIQSSKTIHSGQELLVLRPAEITVNYSVTPNPSSLKRTTGQRSPEEKEVKFQRSEPKTVITETPLPIGAEPLTPSSPSPPLTIERPYRSPNNEKEKEAIAEEANMVTETFRGVVQQFDLNKVESQSSEESLVTPNKNPPESQVTPDYEEFTFKMPQISMPPKETPKSPYRTPPSSPAPHLKDNPSTPYTPYKTPGRKSIGSEEETDAGESETRSTPIVTNMERSPGESAHENPELVPVETLSPQKLLPEPPTQTPYQDVVSSDTLEKWAHFTFNQLMENAKQNERDTETEYMSDYNSDQFNKIVEEVAAQIGEKPASPEKILQTEDPSKKTKFQKIPSKDVIVIDDEEDYPIGLGNVVSMHVEKLKKGKITNFFSTPRNEKATEPKEKEREKTPQPMPPPKVIPRVEVSKIIDLATEGSTIEQEQTEMISEQNILKALFTRKPSTTLRKSSRSQKPPQDSDLASKRSRIKTVKKKVNVDPNKVEVTVNIKGDLRSRKDIACAIRDSNDNIPGAENGSYQTLPYEAIEKLLACLVLKFKLDERSRVIDLGSGYGNITFQTALSYRVEASHGIDIGMMGWPVVEGENLVIPLDKLTYYVSIMNKKVVTSKAKDLNPGFDNVLFYFGAANEINLKDYTHFISFNVLWDTGDFHGVIDQILDSDSRMIAFASSKDLFALKPRFQGPNVSEKDVRSDEQLIDRINTELVKAQILSITSRGVGKSFTMYIFIKAKSAILKEFLELDNKVDELGEKVNEDEVVKRYYELTHKFDEVYARESASFKGDVRVGSARHMSSLDQTRLAQQHSESRHKRCDDDEDEDEQEESGGGCLVS